MRSLLSLLCIFVSLTICCASGPYSWVFGPNRPCSSAAGGTQPGQWVCVDQSSGVPASSGNCTAPVPSNPSCCSTGCVDPLAFSPVVCSGSVIGTSQHLSITCRVNVTMPSGKSISSLDLGRVSGLPTFVSAALFNQSNAIQTTNYTLPVGGNTIEWGFSFNSKSADGFWSNAGGWFHASFMYTYPNGTVWDSNLPKMVLAAGDPTLESGQCAVLVCPLGLYSNSQIECTIQQPMDDNPITDSPMFIDPSDVQVVVNGSQLTIGGISHFFFDPTLRLTLVSAQVTGTTTVTAFSTGSTSCASSQDSFEVLQAWAPASTIATLSCSPNELMYGDTLRSDWASCTTTIKTDAPGDTLPLITSNNTALIVQASVDKAVVTVVGGPTATFNFDKSGYDVEWLITPPQWNSPKVFTGFANMIVQYIQPDGQVVLSAQDSVVVYLPSVNVTSIYLACPPTVTVTAADNGDATTCSVVAMMGNTEVFIDPQDVNVTSGDSDFDVGLPAYDPAVPESPLLWIPAYAYGKPDVSHTVHVQFLSLSASVTIRTVAPAQPSGSGPSGGVIAGAVIGSLFGVTLIGFLIYRFYNRSPSAPANFGISVSTADDTPVEYRAL